MPGKNKTVKKHLRAIGAVFGICLLANLPAIAVSPKIYAVVIGISRYQDNSLNLKYADKDAEAFAAFLKSPGCGSTPAEQVALLVNEDATRANVLKKISKFSGMASPSDVLIIYFSGHGTNATPAGTFFLATYDTDPDNIVPTATSAADVNNILTSSSAKMTFWITDACNAGETQPGKGLNTTPSGAEKFFKAIEEARSGGFVYLTSCQSHEISLEDQKYGGGHGIFTYYLLEGLKGRANANANGIITINACYDYLRLQVISASGDHQHPVLGGHSFNGKFPMSCVTGGYANLITERNTFSPFTHFETTIKVSSFLHTQIRVRKGETISINASGTIRVGPWVGVSGPEGKEGGVLGVSLEQYNIVKTFRHAVSMYKLDDRDEWIQWAPNLVFTAEKDGELIFQVNDNDQGNNYGAYTVTIQKN